MTAELSLARRRAATRVAGLGVTFRLAYRFRHTLAGHRRALAGAAGASAGLTLMRLLEPWPLKVVLDSVLGDLPLSTPWPELNAWLVARPLALTLAAAAAVVGIALLRGVFFYHESLVAAEVGQDVVMRLRRDLFAHLQRLPLSFHARASTGDLLTRLTGDIILLRDLMVASLLSVTSEIAVLVGFAVVMWLMDPLLAVVAVLCVPAILFLVTTYSERIRDATRSQRRREGELASRLHEVLNGIHVVQAFAREDVEDERLRALNKKSKRSGLKAARLQAQMSRGVEVAIAASTALALVVGAQRVLTGSLTAGELVVFVSYMRAFHKPLRRIASVSDRAAKATTCVERITEVLDEPSDVPDGTREAPRLKGDVHLRSVSFAYRPDEPVLYDLNLHIPAGQTVALVGASGAGKTTLMGLIPRLFDPTSGQVLVDGIDVRDLTLNSLRDQISVVPQDGMLFGGTVRENVAYGRLEATDDEIVAACRAALIHDHIVSLPDGYDTVIGERGVTLSGGQRQRLAIARALVKNAPIVLLDEPTTGLDAHSEELVMRAMRRLLTGRTAIVIAHRLTTIQHAHLIAVLDAGRIVESGSHQQLLGQQGPYRALHQRQTRPASEPSDGKRATAAA